VPDTSVRSEFMVAVEMEGTLFGGFKIFNSFIKKNVLKYFWITLNLQEITLKTLTFNVSL
jgi:hypothetical protein